jgi:hypothetical protein
MSYKKLFFSTLAICLIGLSALVYITVRADYNTSVPPYDIKPMGDRISLTSYLAGVPADQLAARFPCDAYLGSANSKQAILIEQDLKELDSLFPGIPSQDKQQLLSVVLTDSLMSRIRGHYDTYQPDSLLLLMDWVESFRHYANAQAEYAFLYNVIYGYWGSFISNQLSAYTRANSKLKYDFRFKILESRCAFNRLTVAPKVTSIEKVIYNILGSHWSHLFDASWNQSSLIQKILFSILFLLTIVAYGCLFVFLKRKVFSKKSVAASN